MSQEQTVTISGIWLRRIGDTVQVLAEQTGKYGRHWFVVIEEHIDGNFSHIVEPAGILDAEIDSVTARPDVTIPNNVGNDVEPLDFGGAIK